MTRRRPCRDGSVSGAFSETRGFTLVELMVVLALLMIVAAIAIPNIGKTMQAYKMASVSRNIAGMVNQAKIRAASDFTLAGINCTDRTSTTVARCVVAVCTTKGSTAGSCNTWTPEGGVQPLPNGVGFSFGNLSTVPPLSGQSSLTETLQIQFNSRGLPVDGSGNPDGNYAIYVQDVTDTTDSQTYALVVLLTGRVVVYEYTGTSWVQQ